jgi:hypothetical protein
VADFAAVIMAVVIVVLKNCSSRCAFFAIFGLFLLSISILLDERAKVASDHHVTRG